MAAPVEEARIPQLIRDWEGQVERLRVEGAPAIAMARPAARLAMLCVEIGRYEDALRWARALLVATDRLPGAPMRVDTLSFIGSVYLDLRQYERAERCLRDVLELDPTCPAAWFNLSHALQMQGRYHEALDASRRAHALRPESGAYRVQLGALLASVVDREKGQAEIRAGAQQLDLAGLPRKFDRIWRWIAARLLGDKEAATRVEALLWPPEAVH